MGVSFRSEDTTMKTLHKTVVFLLPFLVSGHPSDVQDRDGKIMGISERFQCYVFGQCQEYSVNFEAADSAESCHKFCGKNDDCKWWSWEPDQSGCFLFANCTDIKQSTGHPNIDPCHDCISGQRACPARECHSPHKCKGKLDDSFIVSHLEDCISICKDRPSCKWYTLDKAIDRCVLYDNCTLAEDCDTCATGPEYCSRGYHGVEKKQRQRSLYYGTKTMLEGGTQMFLHPYNIPHREACIDICKERVPAESDKYNLHESTEFFVAFEESSNHCILSAYRSSYSCPKGFDCHNCAPTHKSWGPYPSGPQ